MWLWQLERALRTLPPLRNGAICFLCKLSGYRRAAVVCDPGTMDKLCAQCAINYAKMRQSAKLDMEQALRNVEEERR